MMKKLQEIDKMKHIIFDENQLEMFNFLSKPLICIEDSSQKSPERKDKMKKGTFRIGLNPQQDSEKDNIKKLILHFDNKISFGKLSEIDQRLLENLDKDLANFIENSN